MVLSLLYYNKFPFSLPLNLLHDLYKLFQLIFTVLLAGTGGGFIGTFSLGVLGNGCGPFFGVGSTTSDLTASRPPCVFMKAYMNSLVSLSRSCLSETPACNKNHEVKDSSGEGKIIAKLTTDG